MNAPSERDAGRPLSQARIPDDVFATMRRENLARWPTGSDVDLDEAAVLHRALPPHKQWEKAEALANFDLFARTMCKSPELAYLAIMAMAVRQNPKDATVRAKYDEVRGTIQGHLNAIDNIANGA